MKYFAKIRFLGTDFSGFQVQPDKRTVQGELTNAFSEYFSSAVKITGCSRTDSGVHANEFCITVEAEGASTPADKLPLALAKHLPSDISLIYAKEAPCDFHPRYDCVGKEYLYRIYNARVNSPFEVDRAFFLPRIISKEGIAKMRDAARYFLGEHDFASFMASGSDVESTVRRIEYLNIEKNGDVIEIRVFANGFLYNMVRIIVGTLVEVGLGRFSVNEVEEIILAKDRSRAGMTAPASGLYLNRVDY